MGYQLPGFISYDGSCGNSTCQSLGISGNNYPSNTTYTLSFNVTPGYTLSITGISFWRRVSNTGPTTAAISINGTSAFANVTLPTTGANTGTLAPTGSFNNLTGAVSLVLKLTGATDAGGTFRLDDFVIDGAVTATVTGPTVYNVTGGGTTGSNDTGVAIGLSDSKPGSTISSGMVTAMLELRFPAPVRQSVSAITFQQALIRLLPPIHPRRIPQLCRATLL